MVHHTLCCCVSRLSSSSVISNRTFLRTNSVHKFILKEMLGCTDVSAVISSVMPGVPFNFSL